MAADVWAGRCLSPHLLGKPSTSATQQLQIARGVHMYDIIHINAYTLTYTHA